MRWLAVVLSCSVGFLSLSQEILWVRLISFSYQSVPQAFAYVLGNYLIGIALGAEIGKRVCDKGLDLVKACAVFLCFSSLVDILTPLLYARAATSGFSLPVELVLIISGALFKSALFPMVHHMGSQGANRRLGSSISFIYCCNIIGSTLGPLITGFILLNHMGVQRAMALVSLGDLLLAALCFSCVASWRLLALPALGMIPVFWLLAPANTLVPKLMRGNPKRILENRHGIIHVLDGAGGDEVYGGNAYDGRVNVDLKVNSNLINRVYALAALHPHPARVLVIGLSTGAWTKILSGFKGVERIDVVEINPGYLELIRDYPVVADILTNPKIHIDIDDGRRWLKRHPKDSYDLIVMNTTWHWRSYTSNLLSREFMELLRSHMNPGAILAYNSTESLDAFRTAISVFPHAYKYINFIMAGDRDFRADLSGGFDAIAAVRWGECAAFDIHNPADVKAIRNVMNVPFQTYAKVEEDSRRPGEIITEQNMITEYKYGKGMNCPWPP